MPLKRCHCVICRSRNTLIDARIIRKHLQKYGSEDSPTSSPWKVPSNGNSDSEDDAQAAAACYFTSASDAEGSESHILETVQEEESSDIVNNLHFQEDDDSATSDVCFHEDTDSIEDETSSDESSNESDPEDSCSSLPWSCEYNKTVYSSGVAVQKLPNSDLTLLQ
ncbi:uncharacterized protein LOC110453510 isoform X2 [Mizuhopecten yessoensis]|uniref:uncharacterized protein LOC110453510 isoform X2 n=1 Tax=Mizuhopecten yessoensis TaxID=6573 RepID=UPI000B457B19|nr:uncharacterized protein LOC110453510 isoform X2 [Mizuhopecten yessoensis]